MKTQPLALNALLCVGALLAPAFLASCREAPERQAQIRFGLFPNVTHVQGLVARHFSRTGEGWFEKRIFERTGKNISILWYAYNAGPGAMEAMFVLDNYMALMKKQGLKILDSMIPDLCRYDKELSSRTRTNFRCSLLPPPAGQLKGSGLQELANELIEKYNLKLRYGKENCKSE